MNRTFQKAVYLLSRPVSLLALVLLFLNDHVLRVLWPSWITGKLGDFAWLFFAPFALVALLALLIPRSVREHEKLVGLLAFGIVGTAFFLGNSFVVTHGFILAVVDGLIPFPVQIIRDPVDLIALVVMVPAWRMWQSEALQPSVGRARGALLVSVAACLTIANAPMPDYGIDCLYVEKNRTVAVSNYYSFFSQDGGMSWEELQEDAVFDYCWEVARDEDGIVADPDNETTLFRMNSSRHFEVSENQGQTWQEVPQLRMSSEAAMAFITSDDVGYLHYSPGPFQVVRDLQTGNLIFSMGLEGVVVLTTEGKWAAVAVGDYGLERYSFAKMPILLIGEILLAIEAFLLVFITLYQVRLRNYVQAALSLILWAGWGFVIAMQPARNSGYGLMIQYPGLALVGVFGLLIMEICFSRLRDKYTGELAPILLKISAISGVVFLLPFVLWGGDIIHKYETAMIAGLVLGGLAVIAGIVWVLKTPLELKEPEEDEPAPEEAEAVEETEAENED